MIQGTGERAGIREHAVLWAGQNKPTVLGLEGQDRTVSPWRRGRGRRGGLKDLFMVVTLGEDIPSGWAVNNLPANAGDMGVTPGSGRPVGEGNGSPLQYSCLGNPVDRADWWATVHGVEKSQTNRKTATTRTSLVIQWLRLHTLSARGAWVQSLVRELRSHVLCS